MDQAAAILKGAGCTVQELKGGYAARVLHGERLDVR